jgi:hypothetical protein
LQPLFAALAVGGVGYQVWLVRSRPPFRRTRTAMVILWTSATLTLLVLGVWLTLWLRYR